MKTVVLNKQQLKDTVNGKEVVTVESVKKDERFIEHWEAPLNKLKGKITIPAMIHNGKETVFQIGEVRHAVNEKGEEQYYCPDCKAIVDIILTKIGEFISHRCKRPNFSGSVPLLVLLTKTKQETYGGKSEAKFWFNTWSPQK